MYQCQCKVCGKSFVRPRKRGSFECCTPCQSNARVRAWKADNPERAKAINIQPSPEFKLRYAKSERGMAKSREKSNRWYHKEPERAREIHRQHYAKNRDRLIQKVVNRSKRLRRSTPPWADLNAIAAIYAEARRLTAVTGIEHHVDHIIPLNGRNVCGLHIAANLRVVPAVINRSKYNKLISVEVTTNSP